VGVTDGVSVGVRVFVGLGVSVMVGVQVGVRVEATGRGVFVGVGEGIVGTRVGGGKGLRGLKGLIATNPYKHIRHTVATSTTMVRMLKSGVFLSFSIA